MISRKVRYIVFALALMFLVGGNITVHIVGMSLSEQSLNYEKEITALKQSNLQLESQIFSKSSLQAVAAFAKSEGYESSGPAVRWVEPVIAARQ